MQPSIQCQIWRSRLSSLKMRRKVIEGYISEWQSVYVRDHMVLSLGSFQKVGYSYALPLRNIHYEFILCRLIWCSKINEVRFIGNFAHSNCLSAYQNSQLDLLMRKLFLGANLFICRSKGVTNCCNFVCEGLRNIGKSCLLLTFVSLFIIGVHGECNIMIYIVNRNRDTTQSSRSIKTSRKVLIIT